MAGRKGKTSVEVPLEEPGNLDFDDIPEDERIDGPAGCPDDGGDQFVIDDDDPVWKQ